jgi:hypothetical protein
MTLRKLILLDYWLINLDYLQVLNFC